jgi:hypothetical protein
MCKGCMYYMYMVWHRHNAIPELIARNEGLSKREFTMTVMYRINQSVTTCIAQYVVDKNSISKLYDRCVIYVAKQKHRNR